MTIYEHILLTLIFLGGLALMGMGIKMLMVEDDERNRDNLCPPHQWAYQEDNNTLQCTRCSRTPTKVTKRRPSNGNIIF